MMRFSITAVFQSLGSISARGEMHGFESGDGRCCTDTSHWRSAAP